MFVCITMAILIKWIWPFEGPLIDDPAQSTLSVAPAPFVAAEGALYETSDSASLTFYPHLYVSPSGDDITGDGSVARPWRSIQCALRMALPGTTVHLADGRYDQDVITVRDGTPSQPIRIVGEPAAVISGNGAIYVIEIQHDYIELQGFTIDGLWESKAVDQPGSYRRKLIYAHSPRPLDGITGLRVLSMTIQNAGDECLRLKYFATLNEVAYSNFNNCGQLHFRFVSGKKNGENIYIGTAPEQLTHNPTHGMDQSNQNWVHHNTFVSNGNECVDIKEGSSQNIVEYNDCAKQQDAASGGFNVRGNNNTFRFNRIVGNLGAGIRLGGDTDADGVDNNVYYNEMIDNAVGGVKFQRPIQGIVCGNHTSAKPSAGQFAASFTPDAPCPNNVPRPNGRLGKGK